MKKEKDAKSLYICSTLLYARYRRPGSKIHSEDEIGYGGELRLRRAGELKLDRDLFVCFPQRGEVVGHRHVHFRTQRAPDLTSLFTSRSSPPLISMYNLV